MKKSLLVHLPGEDEPTLVSYQSRSWQAVVIGADSPQGIALATAMTAVGFRVLGYGEAPQPTADRRPDDYRQTAPAAVFDDYRQTDYAAAPAVPDDCNLVLYCHDAARHPSRHVPLLDALCRSLAATRTDLNQVHVALLTPASACQTSARIRENASLHPHSPRELAAAQAELTLHAWCCQTHTAILPNIFRHGELYGLDTGHIAACLRHARAGRPVQLPGLGNQKRTLTHLDDLAAAVATLLKDDFTPSPINLPGETLTVIDYLLPIADRFGVDLDMTPDCHSDDFPWGVGDCVLSSALFKSEAPTFRLCHRFRSWLASLPDAF